MAQAKITNYPEPRTMYLRDQFNRVTKIDATGETSRSWVTGNEWDRYRYAKREYVLVDQQEYDLWIWACEHRYQIAKIVGNWQLDATTLKQVADLVGFKEPGK